MMEYKYIKRQGALQEGAAASEDRLAGHVIAADAVVLVPGAFARENLVMPLRQQGELLLVAAVNARDVMLTDKLRFILNRDVRLVPTRKEDILRAINRHYSHAETESVGSMLAEFTDTAIDFTETEAAAAKPRTKARGWLSAAIEIKKGIVAPQMDLDDDEDDDEQTQRGGGGVFTYVVEEGQRVLMRLSDGTMEVLVGPKKVWRWGKKFSPMLHHVAHPGEFLIVRYRDGRQEHLVGPADLWADPRVHQSVKQEDALQLAGREAVVVYGRNDSGTISRRVVHGPMQFVPQPGEWLHTFSWHSSVGGHKGAKKEPNALVFQKLWLMPDQMYHDVADVRTADDAVLTVRLMIFFELSDIERMLDTTHDPIGDFVNATTSDVVDLVGRHDFEAFKHNTHLLNELETYRQLTGRAAQCGYRIVKVVYRGYGAPESLQQMHDQAIAARTKLQLERATEQQAQDLENYKLDCQIKRATKRRTEQAAEVGHELDLSRQRQEAELRQREASHTVTRDRQKRDAEVSLGVRQQQDAQQVAHLDRLKEMGVDLTAFLTQGRADRVIELRGNGVQPHLHRTGPTNHVGFCSSL